MSRRILLVEGSKPVAAALRKHLEAGGWSVDAQEPPLDLAAIASADYEAAILGADSGGEDLCRDLKESCGTLPVLLSYPPDRDDADARAAQAKADGVLVGPLKKPVVLAGVAAMARLRGLLKQVEELERRLEARTGTAPPPSAAPNVVYDFDFFKRLLLMEIKRSKRYRYPIALALVSVDGWREHTTALDAAGRTKLGAALLSLLTDSVRDIDIPLIYSEERFLVFMPHTPLAGSLVVAKRLCTKVRTKFEGGHLTASVGVAAFEGEGSVSFATLIKGATEALRRAQVEGGDRAYAMGSEERF